MSTKTQFFGRFQELDVLKNLMQKSTASLVVIKGRRRIGKSRLSEELAELVKSYIFVGLAPEHKITAHMQREDFVHQMQRQLHIPGISADDWGDIFWHLANHAQEGRLLIVLDEINWMGDLDPTFLAKLKTAWDRSFSKNPELIMILSGSMSKWIEDNILSSTGFHGRLSATMTLDELSLPACNQFWGLYANRVSAYEKFKILSVTGGIPRYLEEVHPEWTAEKNIMALCYQKESILLTEFDRIFSDLFSRRSTVYKKIVAQCVQGNASLDSLTRASHMQKGGTISNYVDDLVETGYLSRDITWHLKSGHTSKLCTYRLKDNYLRFYLKFIEPYTDKIKRNEMTRLPAWDSIMGLQFENLVLNNRKIIKKILNLHLNDIVVDNPYFQKATQHKQGCQIDYLIQTKYNSLHVCEVKFSKNPIGISVIKELKQKIEALGLAKNFSVWPVLIHVNGVTNAVKESGFFSHIINFSEFLESRMEFY